MGTAIEPIVAVMTEGGLLCPVCAEGIPGKRIGEDDFQTNYQEGAFLHCHDCQVLLDQAGFRETYAYYMGQRA